MKIRGAPWAKYLSGVYPYIDCMNIMLLSGFGDRMIPATSVEVSPG